MDLVTLDNSFRPERLVTNYNSLIWTERYLPAGEFELKTYDVSSTLNSLKLNSFISLRDTTEVMCVETHHISEPKNDSPILTVTGRSYETVLERRAAVPALDEPVDHTVAWQLSSPTPALLAHYLIDYVVIQGKVSVLDKFPNLYPVDPPSYGEDWEEPENQQFAVEKKDLYTTVIELLSQEGFGIKAVRPSASGDSMRIVLYKGRDVQVVLNARYDVLNSADYLFSRQGSENVEYAYGANGREIVSGLKDEPNGYNRYVGIVDKITDTKDITNPALKSVLEGASALQMSQNHETAMFGGEISDQFAFKYNVDYALGDKIKMVGKYGLVSESLVTEYIRTEDNTGEKAYPTLEVIQEAQ